MTNHSTTFINGTALPIIIETLRELCYGLFISKSTLVKPHETITVESSTGEWNLTTYIYDTEIANQLLTAGYTLGKTIGKFRNKPCIQGNYSWMYHDDFQIVYDNDKKTATFLHIHKCV
jgi:hypothetical protein